jgi:acrylyl-CoA reductase (NADPH)
MTNITLNSQFKALVAREADKKHVLTIEDTDSAVLADGDVLVRVAWSGINYKDALAVTGKGKILRSSPIVPGIDYAGEVAASDSPNFAVGDNVLLTGFGVGEKHSGGFAQYARAQAGWLSSLPAGIDARKAMTCGTAGLTAALCVIALRDSGHVPAGGQIAVSGASGGVGSFAVRLLARLGYTVTAVSRLAAADYLYEMGATNVITREEMSADAKPLEKSRWDGAVDTVGGKVLARLLAETNYGGVVAACGLAGGMSLNTTVAPFILRGVRLDGVDSVMIPQQLRAKAWQLLADTLTANDYTRVQNCVVGLDGVIAGGEMVLAGELSGRILVSLWD